MTKKQPYFQRLFFAALLLIVVDCHNDDSPNPTVTVEELGPSHADLNETVTQVLNACQVRDFLDGTRHRVLSSTFQSEPLDGHKTPFDIFQATVYDYTHGRTITVDGTPFDPTTITIVESNTQPLPDEEELAEAGHIAEAQPHEVVTGGMPPVVTRDLPDGRSQRILNIALTSANSSRSVYVNMNNRTVESPPDRRSGKAPVCIAPQPSATDTSLPRGSPGTSNFVIRLGGNVLWTFQAIRPSASSGTMGSGIELRAVKYKGKSVLFQAHVPILNVEYEKEVPRCGPHYRDWQYAEYPLRCSGRDVAPGFRLCNRPAETILDPPHTDGGDFTGVGVYVDGQEVVLKAQLAAGWYRYVSEWRFHVDGTLRPRFGFAAVDQGDHCVCVVHRHHVYWRLDFDIVTWGNNLVREFNQPPIMPSSNYHDKVYEIQRPKDPSHQRHWEISNTRTGSTYSLTPGSNDGTRDAFGIGDLWVLRYNSNEVDDGVNSVSGDAATTRAGINKFINGELVKDKDVVIWYGAHFRHDQVNDGWRVNHVVGPDIRPVQW